MNIISNRARYDAIEESNGIREAVSKLGSHRSRRGLTERHERH